MTGATGLPPDDELLNQLEEELKALKVSDLLVQTLYTVSSLGYRRLSEQDRDLDQELLRDFKQVTANLQLAYAEAAKNAG